MGNSTEIILLNVVLSGKESDQCISVDFEAKQGKWLKQCSHLKNVEVLFRKAPCKEEQL